MPGSSGVLLSADLTDGTIRTDVSIPERRRQVRSTQPVTAITEIAIESCSKMFFFFFFDVCEEIKRHVFDMFSIEGLERSDSYFTVEIRHGNRYDNCAKNSYFFRANGEGKNFCILVEKCKFKLVF